MNRDKIFVSFYQESGDKLLAACEIPTGELPDTFAVDTQMHVGGQSFKVIDAKPKEKSDFLKSGKLEIFLEDEETKVALKKKNYSLPTINNKVTPGEKVQNPGDVFFIAESDVRQVEFVSMSFAREINTELLAIGNIYDKQDKEGKFENIHSRKLIESPLETSRLSVDNIQEIFQVQKRYDSVGYNESKRVIANSFAFLTIDSLILWGEIVQDNIAFLNLVRQKNTKDCVCEKMDRFLIENNLYLVDWKNLTIVGENRNSFQSLLTVPQSKNAT
ncbi:hypothetical protein [Candidatus Uabimicrobium sp. HlEnr_7]|uniref:hypothetical protein n=1 Tax=Candidatus Uabimicrobium helgolandensis TaxID=3095367 RepID=UPI0035579592